MHGPGRLRSSAQGLGIDTPVGFQRPAKTRWATSPSFSLVPADEPLSGRVLTGSDLGDGITLHHDGDENSRVTIRRPADYSDGAEFEFGPFAADYFSLAFGIPETVARAITRNDLIRIALRSESAAPFDAYARLNLVNGPNTENVVRMLPVGAGDSYAEFDIYYTGFEPERASGAWIDLIVNAPAQRHFTLHEVVLLLRRRASL